MIPDWIVRVYLIALRGGHSLDKVRILYIGDYPFLAAFAYKCTNEKDGLQAFIDGLQDE